MALKSWIKSVNNGCRADVLALFILCFVMGTHAFVHLNNNNYWTSLKDDPKNHSLYVQRCNIHVSYMGHGIFVEHALWTCVIQYEIFGVSEPLEVEVETEPVVVGKLSADETRTLNLLLQKGLSTSRKPTATVSKPMPEVIP